MKSDRMIDPDLPDELQGGPSQPDASTSDALVALGRTVAEKRDDAVKARKASGIEDVWMAAERAYISMDDANAHEFANAKWAKPQSSDGPVTRETGRPDETKSTVYIPLTRRYVDAAAAMVSEIILPIDGKAFSFSATPVPDLVDQADDDRQVVDDAPDGTGLPLVRPTTEDEQQQQAAQGQPPQPSTPLTVADLAQEKLDDAKAKAEKAEERVYDWMVEAKYPLQMRKVVFDAARIGTGVLKGPFPNQRKKRAITTKGGQIAVEYVFKTTPDMTWIDPWNFFPEDGCGENVHDGDWCFERDFLSPGKLLKLKNEKTSSGQPIYIGEAIDQVIEEGPEKVNTDAPRTGSDKSKKKRFAIWYCYGRLSRGELQAANAIGLEELPADETSEGYAILTLVNDTVIRATLNPLDSGNFPFRVIPWSRRDGNWAGVGVGEQVSSAARMVNAATRRLLENAGKSAGCQFVIDPQSIMPADGIWSITPDKIWLKSSDAPMDDARKAFLSVAIQNVGDQLMKIVDYGFKIAEEASSIPLVTQGQDGETSPQTFGQAELQNNNAHTMLRAKAYAVDDHITEPLVNDLYDWLLMDPSVPDDEKGDLDIDAHGSIVMVERAIAETFLFGMYQVITNPVFGVNPKRWIAEVFKSKRMNIDKIKNTDDEQQKIDSTPPPEDPRVTAAKIQAQARSEDSKSRNDRDAIFAQAEQQKNAADHEERMQELNMKWQLAQLDYANQRQISLDEVKKELAVTSMKLNVQQRLSTQEMAADLHKHLTSPQVITPPTEPAGRAQPGHAFTQ